MNCTMALTLDGRYNKFDRFGLHCHVNKVTLAWHSLLPSSFSTIYIQSDQHVFQLLEHRLGAVTYSQAGMLVSNDSSW
jgi:hypothetical protein